MTKQCYNVHINYEVDGKEIEEDIKTHAYSLLESQVIVIGNLVINIGVNKSIKIKSYYSIQIYDRF